MPVIALSDVIADIRSRPPVGAVKLSVKPGETTSDGTYTVTEVECLGSCGTAPVVQINNDYLENMTVEKMDAWIRSKSS